MKERRNLTLTNWALLAAAVAYVGIVVERERVHGRGEVFPFAPWSLFTLVPNQTRDYSLKIEAVDGRELAKPIYYEEAGQYFSWSSKHAPRMAIQRLGKALERGDARAAAVERKQIELVHMDGRSGVRYVVVWRSYDVLRRWRDGVIEQEKALAKYQIGEKPS